ncbi:helix-turn-helix domain-containing protein [Hymenobacter endophyticus]|uniref:AraC family transcriptional regulator n=1 Tax=Hymenobacter endophyticus TaxID=3076335 RepID=A0ABU3TKI7_9BACT|nr:AraC family transcriptional regulator [Hymenobacter endophyticus]MDU0371893.1 AraC family transcriptional regulator [Hymenobacter endophyticus]
MNNATSFLLYDRPALASSAGQAWPGLRVERYQLEAMAMPAHAHDQHVLIIHQGSQPVRSSRQNGSRTEEELFRAGDAGLYPAGEYGATAWHGPADIIQLHLNPQALEHRVSQQGSKFILRDRFRFEDGLLTQLGRQLLMAAGSRHALGLLYVESLTNALCYQLLEHHATQQRRPAPGRTLSGPILARIEAYLEDTMEQVVTVEALAELANLSVFHFTRCFRHTTGQSPYQYVLGWKIRRAQHLLRAGELPVAAVGEVLGFASPAHFAAAFKRATGHTPRDFQRR